MVPWASSSLQLAVEERKESLQIFWACDGGWPALPALADVCTWARRPAIVRRVKRQQSEQQDPEEGSWPMLSPHTQASFSAESQEELQKPATRRAAGSQHTASSLLALEIKTCTCKLGPSGQTLYWKVGVESQFSLLDCSLTSPFPLKTSKQKKNLFDPLTQFTLPTVMQLWISIGAGSPTWCFSLPQSY